MRRGLREAWDIREYGVFKVLKDYFDKDYLMNPGGTLDWIWMRIKEIPERRDYTDLHREGVPVKKHQLSLFLILEPRVQELFLFPRKGKYWQKPRRAIIRLMFQENPDGQNRI